MSGETESYPDFQSQTKYSRYNEIIWCDKNTSIGSFILIWETRLRKIQQQIEALKKRIEFAENIINGKI